MAEFADAIDKTQINARGNGLGEGGAELHPWLVKYSKGELFNDIAGKKERSM